MSVERLGPERFNEIVDSLAHLDEHDVQHIMAACACEILNRHGGIASRSYRPGEITVCYAVGPAADLLDKQWRRWKQEVAP